MNYSNKDYVFFKAYKSHTIQYEDVEQLRSIINVLDKSQDLVNRKANKVLVHGNLNGNVLMIEDNKIIGLAEWQKCHYGDKFEDRVELLSNVDIYHFRNDFLIKFNDIFEIISQGFDENEKRKLIEKTINILDKKVKSLPNNKEQFYETYNLKERSIKLEIFKKIYFEK